jgi:nitrate reductase molybdenum cofactor assembly chaperone NarJ/NarW
MSLRGRTRATRSTVYKLCSVLLSYPDAELLDARDELRDAVQRLPTTPARASLERFCAWWCGEGPLALQQDYVATFDLEKRCGLYLTYYGQGDRRERGMALLRLRKLYRAAGLPQQDGELPDYLPVMLEFAASAPSGRGELVLREHRAALELVRASLRDRGTPYADVLDAACLTLGEPSATDRARALKLAASGPPQELVGLEPFAPPDVMPTSGGRR